MLTPSRVVLVQDGSGIFKKIVDRSRSSCHVSHYIFLISITGTNLHSKINHGLSCLAIYSAQSTIMATFDLTQMEANSSMIHYPVQRIASRLGRRIISPRWTRTHPLNLKLITQPQQNSQSIFLNSSAMEWYAFSALRSCYAVDVSIYDPDPNFSFRFTARP